MGTERHLLCIEDPFELSHDLGRTVHAGEAGGKAALGALLMGMLCCASYSAVSGAACVEYLEASAQPPALELAKCVRSAQQVWQLVT